MYEKQCVNHKYFHSIFPLKKKIYIMQRVNMNDSMNAKKARTKKS